MPAREGGHGPPLRGTGTGRDGDGNGTSSESSFFTLVYVVTRDSFTNTLPSRDTDLGPPSLALPHHISSVPVTPDSEGVRAHGAPGQGGQYLWNMAGAGEPPWGFFC